MTEFEGDLTELLNVDNPDSLLRKLMLGKETVRLSDMGIKPYLVSNGYSLLEISLSGESAIDTSDKLKPVFDLLEEERIPPYASASIGEAVINAYVHGNKKDSSKPIRVHYKVNKDCVHVLVEDGGGEINSDFISYMLRQRVSGLNKSINYYDFSGREQPTERGGTGTMIINQYSDSVGYHMSEKGGLIVSMKFNKEAPKEKN